MAETFRSAFNFDPPPASPAFRALSADPAHGLVAVLEADTLSFSHWLLPAKPLSASERLVQSFSRFMGPAALVATTALLIRFAAF